MSRFRFSEAGPAPLLSQTAMSDVINATRALVRFAPSEAARLAQDLVAEGPGAAIIRGTSGDDFLNATSSTDEIIARGGDDVVFGRGGSDAVFGGSGDDRLSGGDRSDLLVGGTGDDALFGGTGADLMIGDGGVDVLVGGAGRDRLFGGAGTDLIRAGGGNDRAVGGAGSDVIGLGRGRDAAVHRNDQPGTDYYDGGSGVDTFILRLASDDIDSAMKTDLAGFVSSFGTPGTIHDFTEISASATNFERLRVIVDGDNLGTATTVEELALLFNAAPTLEDALMSAIEDGPSATLDLSTLAGDPDDGEDGTTLTYTITGQPAGGLATISGSTLTFSTNGDYQELRSRETTLVAIEITATDALGATATSEIQVTVLGTSESSFSLVTPTVIDENERIVTDLVATDDEDATEGDGLSYAITGGADAAVFSIDPDTGELRFLINPDFEAPADADIDNTYEVEVTLSNAGRAADTQLLSFTIQDVLNETIFGTPEADTLAGADGFDTLFGRSGDDVLIGNDQADLIIGERGNDTLFGGGGPDTFQPRQGFDRMEGGAGDDAFMFDIVYTEWDIIETDTITDYDADEDRIIVNGLADRDVQVSSSSTFLAEGDAIPDIDGTNDGLGNGVYIISDGTDVQIIVDYNNDNILSSDNASIPGDEVADLIILLENFSGDLNRVGNSVSFPDSF